MFLPGGPGVKMSASFHHRLCHFLFASSSSSSYHHLSFAHTTSTVNAITASYLCTHVLAAICIGNCIGNTDTPHAWRSCRARLDLISTLPPAHTGCRFRVALWVPAPGWSVHQPLYTQTKLHAIAAHFIVPRQGLLDCAVSTKSAILQPEASS